MFEFGGLETKLEQRLVSIVQKGKNDGYSDSDVPVVDEYLAKGAQKGKYGFCVGLMPDRQSFILEVVGFESDAARETMWQMQKRLLERIGLKIGEKTFTQLSDELLMSIDDETQRRGVLALAKSNLDHRRKHPKSISKKDEPVYLYNAIRGYIFDLKAELDISGLINTAVKYTIGEIKERKRIMGGEGKSDFDLDNRLKELSERLVDIVKLQTQLIISPPATLKPAIQTK